MTLYSCYSELSIHSGKNDSERCRKMHLYTVCKYCCSLKICLLYLKKLFCSYSLLFLSQFLPQQWCKRDVRGRNERFQKLLIMSGIYETLTFLWINELSMRKSKTCFSFCGLNVTSVLNLMTSVCAWKECEPYHLFNSFGFCMIPTIPAKGRYGDILLLAFWNCKHRVHWKIN